MWYYLGLTEAMAIFSSILQKQNPCYIVKNRCKAFSHPQLVHKASPEQIKFEWVFIEDEHDSLHPEEHRYCIRNLSM